jgi:hypothetical protein
MLRWRTPCSGQRTIRRANREDRLEMTRLAEHPGDGDMKRYFPVKRIEQPSSATGF